LANAIVAGGGAVGGQTQVAAGVAILAVGCANRLSQPSSGSAVAVTKPVGQMVSPAGVVFAVRGAAGRGRALGAALAAIVDILADVFFAAVFSRLLSQSSKPLLQVIWQAPAMQKGAPLISGQTLVAGPAIELVLVEIDLAAVGGVAVAIGVALVTAIGGDVALAACLLGVESWQDCRTSAVAADPVRVLSRSAGVGECHVATDGL